jgi:hypothetical protein
MFVLTQEPDFNDGGGGGEGARARRRTCSTHIALIVLVSFGGAHRAKILPAIATISER